MEQFVKDTVTIPCPICKSTSDSPFMFLQGFGISRCSNCHFIFVNPRPTEECLLKLYSNKEINRAFKAHHEPVEYELPVLSKLIWNIQNVVPGGELLEVGCGRGDFLRVAQAHGFSVTGCDMFGEQQPVFEGISFREGPLTSAKFPDNAFDVVVMRNLLEHLFDPNVEINEIRRILKPNGYVFLKVPNVMFEHGFRCRLTFGREHNLDPPHHLNYFSPSSLKAFLRKSHLKFVSWYLEQPTFYSRRTLNLKRQVGYRIIQTLFFLSGGRMFPKIVLSCIAKKS
jgi:SAM-dependent methyltransferase